MAFLDRMRARPDTRVALVEDDESESEDDGSGGVRGGPAGGLFQDGYLDRHPILMEYMTQSALEAKHAAVDGEVLECDTDSDGDEGSDGERRLGEQAGSAADSGEGPSAAMTGSSAQASAGSEAIGVEIGGGEEDMGGGRRGGHRGGVEDIVFIDVATANPLLTAAGAVVATSGAVSEPAANPLLTATGSGSSGAAPTRIGSARDARPDDAFGRGGSCGGGRGYAAELRRVTGVLSQV